MCQQVPVNDLNLDTRPTSQSLSPAPGLQVDMFEPYYLNLDYGSTSQSFLPQLELHNINSPSLLHKPRLQVNKYKLTGLSPSPKPGLQDNNSTSQLPKAALLQVDKFKSITSTWTPDLQFQAYQLSLAAGQQAPVNHLNLGCRLIRQSLSPPPRLQIDTLKSITST
ncbi:hypothetical protein K493DRAFT_300572 [Basidiobolus meristosporus CBS 931.73]|uniref:Uncharacterized protein n=1 Tax=Basidiobolus meristosporus CBS 931.73 TaxID=1314790 RepID=A0A1Y1YGL1_9FUNG|nr:hypothetical protein K493DRAFT_308745 [Basidiobolus meristosporus CBS 931.73]ORX97151.1 hypothetical protein K493DRAFT_300572 [Basidiobolus meristosporus CBS 931.73]|eukprot:ORX78201.1 hypothetical protein K493DRAFT_308745 [Basidiobolus meristosporus CBS 931.73]